MSRRIRLLHRKEGAALSKEKKQDPRTLNSNIDKEFEKYIEANEESGKKAAIPTPESDLPKGCLDGRQCYLENEPNDGKSYPTLGV